ncbi:hypothetical protein X772_35700 [Mesorhizobium sp. LSJC280B00]|nr:hypothetical protein X772_35700 [Mesorhizobium sp. LSJC280B00]
MAGVDPATSHTEYGIQPKMRFADDAVDAPQRHRDVLSFPTLTP